MSCEETRDRLVDLPAHERESVAHLAICGECRAFAAQLRQAEDDVFEHVEDFALRDGFDDAWAAAVQAPSQTGSSAMSWYIHTGSVAAVTAAVVILGIIPTLRPDMLPASLRTVEDPETVMVIVAAAEIPAGTTLGDEHIYAVEMPPDYVTKGFYTRPDLVVGQVTKERLLADDYIRCERLQPGCSGPADEVEKVDWINTSVGKSIALEFPGLPSEVLLDDPDVATVKSLRGALTQIIGLTKGETQLTAKVGDKVFSYSVRVEEAEAIPKRRADVFELTAGGSKELELPDVPVAASVSDTSIALLEQTDNAKLVRLVGKKPGVTDLVIVFEEGPPMIFEVDIYPAD